jgi:hypothetical protein
MTQKSTGVKCLMIMLMLVLMVEGVWGEEKTISLSPIGDGYYLYENGVDSGFKIKPSAEAGKYDLLSIGTGYGGSDISIGTMTVEINAKTGTTNIKYEKHPETNYQASYRPGLISVQTNFESQLLTDETSKNAFSHTVAKLNSLVSAKIMDKTVSTTAEGDTVKKLEANQVSFNSLPIITLYKDGKQDAEFKQIKVGTKVQAPAAAGSAPPANPAPAQIPQPAAPTSIPADFKGTVMKTYSSQFEVGDWYKTKSGEFKKISNIDKRTISILGTSYSAGILGIRYSSVLTFEDKSTEGVYDWDESEIIKKDEAINPAIPTESPVAYVQQKLEESRQETDPKKAAEDKRKVEKDIKSLQTTGALPATPSNSPLLQEGKFFIKDGEKYQVSRVEITSIDGEPEMSVTILRFDSSGLIESKPLSYKRDNKEIENLFSGATELSDAESQRLSEVLTKEYVPTQAQIAGFPTTGADGEQLIESLLTPEGKVPTYSAEDPNKPIPIKTLTIQYENKDVRFQDLKPGDILTRYNEQTGEYDIKRTVKSVEVNKFLWLFPTSSTVTYEESVPPEKISSTQPVQRPLNILSQLRVGDIVEPTSTDTLLNSATRATNKEVIDFNKLPNGKIRVSYRDGSTYELYESNKYTVRRPTSQTMININEKLSEVAKQKDKLFTSQAPVTQPKITQPSTITDTDLVEGAVFETPNGYLHIVSVNKESGEVTTNLYYKNGVTSPTLGSVISTSDMLTLKKADSRGIINPSEIQSNIGAQGFVEIQNKISAQVTPIEGVNSYVAVDFLNLFEEKQRDSVTSFIKSFPEAQRASAIDIITSFPESRRDTAINLLKTLPESQRNTLIAFPDSQFYGTIDILNYLPDAQLEGAISTLTSIPKSQRSTAINRILDLSDKNPDAQLNFDSSTRTFSKLTNGKNAEDGTTTTLKVETSNGQLWVTSNEETRSDNKPTAKTSTTVINDATGKEVSTNKNFFFADKEGNMKRTGGFFEERPSSQLITTAQGVGTMAIKPGSLYKMTIDMPGKKYEIVATTNDKGEKSQVVTKTILDDKGAVVSTETFSRAVEAYFEFDNAMSQSKSWYDFGFSKEAAELRNRLEAAGAITSTRATISTGINYLGGLMEAANRFPGLSAFSNLIRDKELRNWKEDVYEHFTKQVVGMGYVKSKICEQNFKTFSGGGSVLMARTAGGGYEAGAWIQVDKLETKIKKDGNVIPGYTYRTTFYINNPEYKDDLHYKNRDNIDMLYNIVFKTKSKPIKWFKDDKLIPLGKSAGQSIASLTSKDKILVPIFQSKTNYVEVCLEFRPEMVTLGGSKVKRHCVPVTDFKGGTYTSKEKESTKTQETAESNDGIAVMEGD